MNIPVTYKNKDLPFKAHVVRFGYVHCIIVDLDGVQVNFEGDEEGQYRSEVDDNQIKDRKVNVELVRAIIRVLMSL